MLPDAAMEDFYAAFSGWDSVLTDMA